MSLLSGLSGLRGSDAYNAGKKQEILEDTSSTGATKCAYMGPDIGKILGGQGTQQTASAFQA